jgi:hypothetical protein
MQTALPHLKKNLPLDQFVLTGCKQADLLQNTTLLNAPSLPNITIFAWS